MMSATQKAAQDTPDDSEESSYEESSEAFSVQKQETQFQVVVPDANATKADDDPRKLDIAIAERKKQATGELPSTKAKEPPQPNSNIRGRTASTRLSHTQSLQGGRKNMSSYAQRQCDELKEKLDAAELANSLLREKVKLVEANKLELIDRANEVRQDVENLQAALLAREEEYNQMIDRVELAEGEAKQCGIDQTSQERESLRLLGQIQDLKDENKRLLHQNNTFQIGYTTCCAKLERKREEALDFCEKGKQYLHQRDVIKKQVEELKAECDRLTLNNANLKRRSQEAVEGRVKAEENESKFKDAARIWKNKYNRAIQEKNDEIQKGTKLAEEISTFRHGNAIQDDPSLRDDLASFRYTVRDWCDRILECKPAGLSAHFSGFPLDNEGPVVLTDLGEKELNVLIASVWEWLIKLVFGYEEDRKDNLGHPDLWLENDKRFCLNSLEQYFRSKDPAVAIQWRHRTVQQLLDSSLCTGDQRFHEAVEEIMKWVTNCLQLAFPTKQLEMLKLDFEKEVLREAVNFALKLRRQNSEINLIIPRSISRGLRSIAVAKTLKAPDSEQNMVQVCIGPQIKKVVPQSGTREAFEGVVLEAEFTDVPFLRWIPEGICSCNNAQQAEDIEVD